MIENERNLRYTARDGPLKLAREPKLYGLLGFKVNCGCLVKEDFATTGVYSALSQVGRVTWKGCYVKSQKTPELLSDTKKEDFEIFK